ncbi:hypothetical protein ACFO9E_18115 [Streptomyces maoxianensis]|uniref:DUF4145 domain-containing protein n=1 Tax=Streptomyces maoxianensis TaxID=1459942 RepID=A0ABV9GAR4_9ACTN
MDDSLSFESFREAAMMAAHRAMDDHGRGHYDEFALHAGVAVERLAKAVLVSKNPIYIAEMKGSAEMLFHLGGHRTAKKVRTIGASEAIARLRMLEILAPDQQLDLLIEVRNGVAHTTSGEQAKSLLPTLAQTVETLLKDLGGPLNAFWGRWTSAARMAVDDKRSQIYRDVQVRIRQAKHRFDDRVVGLSVATKEQILQENPDGIRSVSITSSSSSHDELLILVSTISCPACGGHARFKLLPVSSSAVGVCLIPDALHCTLCALDLNSPEEIKASGVDVGAAMIPASMSISWGPTLPAAPDISEIHVN